MFANDTTSTDNFDTKFDAVDLKSEVVNIGIFSKDNIKLSISSYPNQLASYVNTKFPLTVWAKDTGDFTIFHTNIAPLDSSMELWLKDNYLNKVHDIRAQSYPFKITSNAETKGDNRFELFAIKNNTTTNEKLQKKVIRIAPNPVKSQADFMVLLPDNSIGPVHLQIVELSGKKCFENSYEAIGGQSNLLIINTNRLSDNIYVVLIRTNQGIYSSKLIIE